MPISSLNSKKCLAVKLIISASTALSCALPLGFASVPQQPSAPSLDSLRREIQSARKEKNFEGALQGWSRKYGTEVVPLFLQLARNSRLEDFDRYVAILAVARTGGSESAPLLVPLLKDRSWMVRVATLRALTILKNPETAEFVVPSLSDAALVVRSEAVDAVVALRPRLAEDALILSIQNGSNYAGGKAQVVPQKALRALASLQAHHLAPRLKPLLGHRNDPALQALTIETLEKLTGRKIQAGLPLAERIKAWQEVSLND